MKTALILFKDPLVPFDGEYLGNITDTLLSGGFPVNSVEIISLDDDLGFKRSIARYKDTADNLVVVFNPNTTFNVKQIVADQMDSVLIENENALKIIQALNSARKENYSLDNAQMPMEATLIPNENGAFQGFMMDENEFTLVVLPHPAQDFAYACQKYLLPYLDKKYSKQTKRMTLKYFGVEEKLKKAIDKAKKGVSGIVEVYYTQKYGDFTIRILADERDGRELNIRTTLLV